jgi:hypothetical protein
MSTEQKRKLFVAVQQGNMREVTRLLPLFRPNQTMFQGALRECPLLEFAVHHSQLEVARVLIAAGADVNMINGSTGRSALQSIASFDPAVVGTARTAELISLLIENGAFIHPALDACRSALLYIIRTLF